VLKYANTDKSKIAVSEIVIPKKILGNLEFSVDIDVNIFTDGVVTMQPEISELFNGSIISIKLERIGVV
jgi:hypothetical protein